MRDLLKQGVLLQTRVHPIVQRGDIGDGVQYAVRLQKKRVLAQEGGAVVGTSSKGQRGQVKWCGDESML